jgi:cysteine synthase A
MPYANQVAGDITDLTCETPIVRLNRIPAPGSAEILVKMESMNPSRSVKDRIARSMVDAAERDGTLKSGMTIVEPTSGNTGIALALVAAARGYSLILTMPDNMSQERRDLLASYGAELVLTPGAEQMDGAVREAERIASDSPDTFFMPQQFRNPANPQIHRDTTAREILDAVNGKLSALVAGVGTGGTVTGVAEVIRESLGDVKIVAVEPARSNVLSGGTADTHRIQGIGASFIPEVLNLDIIDQIICVEDEDALETARRLSREEGIFSGISAGANVFAALQVANEIGEGGRVVTFICDSGERYFSVPGFLDEPDIVEWSAS